MTIQQVLNQIDHDIPNQFDEKSKIDWLAQLDGRIFVEVISTHEGGADSFAGYDGNTPQTRELLAADPYGELYLYYLEARMAYLHGESERYENARDMFNQRYRDYASWYNRTHRPKPAGGYRL